MKLQEAVVTFKRTGRPDLKVATDDDALEAFDFLRDETKEHCAAMYLDANLRVICYETVHIGGMTETVIDNRCILRTALLVGALSIVLIHNHPSGSPRPSAGDKDVTAALKRACKAVDMSLQDHIIIGYDGHYSMRAYNQI